MKQLENNKWKFKDIIIYAPNYETALTRFLNGNKLTREEKDELRKER